MRETVVKISITGQPPRRITLDDKIPTASFYVEHEPFAREQDAGLSEKERKVAIMKRTASALFMTALQTAADLEEIDPEAAADLWDIFSSAFTEDEE